MRNRNRNKVAQARYTDSDGNISLVQITAPWKKLQDGAIPYNPTHDGHLSCVCCDAKVKAVAARASSGGSSGAGSGAYFRPTSKHDADCIIPMRHIPAAGQKIDRNKGYRIHINTSEYSEVFNESSGAYEVSPNGRITITDPDLKNREAYSVGSAHDLILLMRQGEFERIRDSKVIFRNEAVDWDDFCILYSKPKRFKELVERVKYADPEKLPFVFMEVRTSRDHYFSTFERKPEIKSSIIQGDFDEDENKSVEIQPTFQLDKGGMGTLWAFANKGSYMVLGQVSGNSFDADFKIIEYLNMRITDGRQSAFVNIENLAQEAAANADARTALRSSRKPSDPQGELKLSQG